MSLGADLTGSASRLSSCFPVTSPSGPEQATLPRCGRCGASLSESARYRSIEARPGDEEAEEGHGPLTATVLYCGQCGTVLGPAADARHDAVPRR